MIASLVIKLNHDYKRCYHPRNMFTPKERSSNNKLKEARLHMIHPNAYKATTACLHQYISKAK